jgi:hypothetical protein
MNDGAPVPAPAAETTQAPDAEMAQAPDPAPAAGPAPGDAAGAAGRPGDADPAQGPAAASGRRKSESPPGLIAQLRATKDALLGLGRAHVDLARAEADEIKGEAARAAALAAGALSLLLLLAILLPIGAILFGGEWLFGSIGWGLLLGAEMLVAVALSLVVAALRIGAFGRAAVIGLVVGAVVFVLLGASLPHELFRVIGTNAAPGIEAGVRPLLVALAFLGIIGAVLGLAGGARAAGGGGAIGGLVAGAIAGGLLGAFLAVDFGWRVGVALGLVVAGGVYMAILGMSVTEGGLDQDKLKARFWPQATIDTTRETIEWAKARIPRGPRS